MGDFDNDADLDLALFGTVVDQEAAHCVLTNRGDGRFDSPTRFAKQPEMPSSRGVVAADLNGDGALELVVAHAGAAAELWRVLATNNAGWLEIIPASAEDAKADSARPNAVGLLAEIKSGRRLQVGSIASSSGFLGCPPARIHFGLGSGGKCDYVRLSWPDAVFQGELEVPANQHWRITKVASKPSSCPVLFSWDGERFAFVTDFLGTGGLGFFTAPGIYAPPDPTEDVRIPPRRIAPHHGRYLLRIAELLEEVTYFDQLHLIVYDHPEAWELYPDERFVSTGPLPEGRPLAVAQKIFPSSARTECGRDVLDRVLAIDRRYVEPPADPRFVGYAEDHWIERDFGRRLAKFAPDKPVILYLYGWTEYT